MAANPILMLARTLTRKCQSKMMVHSGWVQLQPQHYLWRSLGLGPAQHSRYVSAE